MFKTLKTIAVLTPLIAFCTSVHAGLMVTPTGPITPGTNVTFDLAIQNNTAGGADLTYNFNEIGLLEFCDLDPGFSFVGTNNGFTPLAGWDVFDLSTFGGAGLRLTNADPNADKLINGLAPGADFTFGSLTVFVPATFSGSFDLTLNQTLEVTIQGGINATSNPAVQFGSPSWVGDPTPPRGKSDTNPSLPPPPGGGVAPIATYSFTAVPEPSPVILLGLLTCLIGGRRYLRK